VSLHPSGREILDSLGLQGEPVRVPSPNFPNATVLHPEIVGFMERRTLAFQNATSGAGQPLTYGERPKS
jgi:hypothetical protein